MDVWAQIRHRYATEKISKRELAKQLGVSRGTVDRALAAERPPKYERKPAGSSFDAYAAQVRALLALTPTMPASVLAERVVGDGRKLSHCDGEMAHFSTIADSQVAQVNTKP